MLKKESPSSQNIERGIFEQARRRCSREGQVSLECIDVSWDSKLAVESSSQNKSNSSYQNIARVRSFLSGNWLSSRKWEVPIWVWHMELKSGLPDLRKDSAH